MFKQIDWLFLRRPLIIFSLLIVFSLVFYFGGLQYKNIANEKFNSAKNSLSSSHSKLKVLSSEMKLVDEYLDEYKTLVNEAFIGEERRLSWIESMKAANKEIKLPKFDYSISAQSNFKRPGITQNKAVASLSSAMKLDLGLLHEEDLFKVFELLDENVQSYFTIEGCKLSQGRNKELKIDKSNLTANCVVSWVHLKVATK